MLMSSSPHYINGALCVCVGGGVVSTVITRVVEGLNRAEAKHDFIYLFILNTSSE